MKLVALIGLALAIWLYIFLDPNFQPVPFQLAPLDKFPPARPLQCHTLTTELTGPEDIFFHSDGWAYTGLLNGSIVRFQPPKGDSKIRIEHVVNTGGRPMGIRWHGNTMWIADANIGLLSYSSDTKQLVVRLTDVAGRKLNFADHLVISADGSEIYFSDASIKYTFHHAKLDFFEGRPYGRIIAFNVASNSARVLTEPLYFPNGVELINGGKSLLIVESASHRLLTYTFATKKTEVYASTYSYDNVSREKNLLVFPHIADRDSKIEFVYASALARKLLHKLEIRSPYNGITVIEDSPTWKPKALFVERSGNYSEVSVATLHEGYAYLGSYKLNYIARCKLDLN